jgi:hypothetical protein
VGQVHRHCLLRTAGIRDERVGRDVGASKPNTRKHAAGKQDRPARSQGHQQGAGRQDTTAESSGDPAAAHIGEIPGQRNGGQVAARLCNKDEPGSGQVEIEGAADRRHRRANDGQHQADEEKQPRRYGKSHAPGQDSGLSRHRQGRGLTHPGVALVAEAASHRSGSVACP